LGVKTTFHWDGFGRDTLIERDSGAFQLRLGGDASAGVPAPAATGTIKVRQVFDNLGNLVKLTDPKGLVETRRYDERNRLLWNVYPDDIRHAMGYDLGSRLVTDTVQMVTHPESLTVKVMTYDGLSRLLAESYGASARENVTYAWDNFGAVADLGRLLGITRGTGVTAAYTYDVMGRRLSRGLAMPSLYSVNQSWRYDLGGGVVRQDLPGMAHVSTSYDLYHRLSSESVVHGNDSIAVLHDISYRQNDLVAGYGMGARLTETNNFEAQRLYLTQSLVQKNNSTTKDTLYLQRMSWDGAGNVAGMRRNLGDTLGFDVDRLYQLNNIRYPDGQAISTGFDPNGNRTRLSHPMGRGASDTFTYVANRVATGYTARKGWTSYRHDARGNLSVEASFAQVADTGTLSKAWRVVERRFNKRDELERVRIINRLANLDTTWLRFDYGEDGNRILSAIGKGSDTSSWTVTHKWVYDGSSIVADSGSDHGWNWHVYSGLNRVAEATDSSGKTRVRYVLVDHQGTTQALLSDTGAVLGRWIWDPWGNIEESWTQLTTELLYQGKVYEAAMGDWYFNARWYSPERGSFTGRDAGEQFWTPYSYTGNSPLEGIDPTGMWMDFSAAKSRAYSNSQADMSRYSKAWIAASRNDFKILHALNNFHYVNEAAREVTGTYNSIVNFLPKTILSIVALAYDIGYEVAKGYKGTGGHPFDDQPLLDWLYDTPGDMVANGYGLGVGLIWSGLQTGSDGRRAGDWVFVPVYGIPGPQHQACGEAGMNCSNLLTAGVVASRPSWWWSAKDEDWFAKYLDGDNSAINKAPGAK
jgi:RHS repeat-associated protein